MSRRHATLAATLAGLSLLAAGCGGGGGSDAAAEAPADPAALLAAEVAAPSGLAALGVATPDPADARLRAFGEFGTPPDVFKARVSAGLGTTTVPATVPSTVVPATTIPATLTTPATDPTTTTTGAPLVP